MKLIHLSDLHLGKRLYETSLIEDQSYILSQILDIVREEAPDAVLIAGDVYDRPQPSEEAVLLWDGFLSALHGLCACVCVISGNHDSADRIGFAGQILEERGVYLSYRYEGTVRSVTLTDENGPARIFLLPFVKPAVVRHAHPERAGEIRTWTDALRVCVEEMRIAPEERCVLAAHQFVTGALRSESEEVYVGGLDNVDASVFAPFDYTALGHIHGPQNVGTERIRYCGTPLAYSFSEQDQEKSVTVVTLGKKGETGVRTVPLTPLRRLRTVRGTYEEAARREEDPARRDDFIRVILTDEEDVPEAFGRLKTVYPNLLTLTYDNTRTRTAGIAAGDAGPAPSDPMDLFAAFYRRQNGKDLSPAQEEAARSLLQKITEEEK